MRLLILGAGAMAGAHAGLFSKIEGVEIVGAVDVVEARVGDLCATHGIPRAFLSIDDALAWGGFDAVANATPDAEHFRTTLAAIRAGKHVLCEKPLATSHAEAAEMTEAAERAGVVAMVNFTYRNLPQLQAARDLVLAGVLGDIRHVEASYLQSWLVAPIWGDWRAGDRILWKLSRKHGSNGVLGDLGIHLLDFASYAVGEDIARAFCRLKTFSKADGDRIGDFTLDANDSFTMSVEFDNGALGVLHSSRWATGHANTLRLSLYGDRGGIELQHGSGGSWIRLCAGEDVHAQTWLEVAATPVATNHERFVEAVRSGQPAEPSFAYAAKLQRVLDICTIADNVRAEQRCEEPSAMTERVA